MRHMPAGHLLSSGPVAGLQRGHQRSMLGIDDCVLLGGEPHRGGEGPVVDLGAAGEVRQHPIAAGLGHQVVELAVDLVEQPPVRLALHLHDQLVQPGHLGLGDPSRSQSRRGSLEFGTGLQVLQDLLRGMVADQPAAVLQHQALLA
ncbi:MAG: hypothetical protein CVT62_01920 [Actinobacteria bacterium HGW-Actinobacteria-2]|nr:MAG: hypothetical protein CVT62_01920 [Actinobacteria bacterium HGW-Actinobacteria-2]